MVMIGGSVLSVVLLLIVMINETKHKREMSQKYE